MLFQNPKKCRIIMSDIHTIHTFIHGGISMQNYENAVEMVMTAHHISPKLHGYVYLRDSITYVAQSPYIRLIDTPTATLYAMIAHTYATTPAAVARAIRYALRAAGHVLPPKSMIYGMAMAAMRIAPAAAELSPTAIIQPAGGGTG